MSAIEFRYVGLGEMDAVGSLFEQHWRPGHVFHRRPEVLRWMYHENPYRPRYTDGLSLLGAYRDGELVGVHGCLPLAVNRFGRRLTDGCHLCNWLAAPDMRRGPWSIRLTTDPMRSMGKDACFGFSFTPSSRPILDRLGWSRQPAMPHFVRKLDRGAFNGLFADHPAVREAASGWPAGLGAEVSGDVTEVDDVRSLDWDGAYWERIAPASWGPAREKCWLVWRYQAAPGFTYRFLLARRDGAPSGLLVFRDESVVGTPYTVFRVVDLLAAPGSCLPLLAGLIARGCAEGAAMADFFCASRMLAPDLENMGFVSAEDGEPYPVPFLFRPLDDTVRAYECGWHAAGVDAAAGKSLYLTKGDGDFDRPN